MRIFPFTVFRVSGHSMEPAIKEGSVVVVFQWSYRLRDPRVGEVIALGNNGQVWIKRIKDSVGDKVFLTGDNKEDSLDSRKLGTFSKGMILGKVIKVYSPH